MNTPSPSAEGFNSHGMKRCIIIRDDQCCTCKNIVHTTVDGRNPAAVEVGSLSHYLQVFLHPRWCHICINNIRIISNKHQSFEKRNVHVNILISSASHDDTVNPMIISN